MEQEPVHKNNNMEHVKKQRGRPKKEPTETLPKEPNTKEKKTT